MYYYHFYLDKVLGLPIKVRSKFARKPSQKDEGQNGPYGPWIIYEYIGEKHPAFETAHDSNKYAWSMSSFPECDTVTLNKKCIYLGYQKINDKSNS